MNKLLRQGRRALSGAPSPSPTVRRNAFTHLDPAVKIEEENMAAFGMGLFYPVHIGELFKDRYKVLSKLGFGANSTVWLCRDVQ